MVNIIDGITQTRSVDFDDADSQGTMVFKIYIYYVFPFLI